MQKYRNEKLEKYRNTDCTKSEPALMKNRNTEIQKHRLHVESSLKSEPAYGVRPIEEALNPLLCKCQPCLKTSLYWL